jgi:AcrR family transcriptional regulator
MQILSSGRKGTSAVTEIAAMPERVRRPKRDDVRAALVNVAIKVFERDGFQGANLVEISNLAGFSRGAFYSNFGSKEELFLVALEENAEQTMMKLFSEYEASGSAKPSEMFERQIHMSDAWAPLFVEFCIHVMRHREFAERLAQVRHRIHQKLSALLASSLRQTKGDMTFDEMAVAALALRNGLIIEQLMIGPDETTRIAAKLASLLYDYS